MHKFRPRQHDRPRERPCLPPAKGMELLSRAEQEILRLISSRAPLPEVLNDICRALNNQIGNVVSLISVPADDAVDLTEIALNAVHFGLHAFCSEDVVADDDEPLGSLEMFCSVRRNPSAREYGLIEWAKCLAAIAITLDRETEQNRQRMFRNPPERRNVHPGTFQVN
jgi:hypothetical protein